MTWGAAARTARVAMIVKAVKNTRHRRSNTIAANFQSASISPDSSSLFSFSVITFISFRIRLSSLCSGCCDAVFSSVAGKLVADLEWEDDRKQLFGWESWVVVGGGGWWWKQLFGWESWELDQQLERMQGTKQHLLSKAVNQLNDVCLVLWKSFLLLSTVIMSVCDLTLSGLSGRGE